MSLIISKVDMFNCYIDGSQESTFHGRLSTGTITLLSRTTRFACSVFIFCNNGNLSVSIFEANEYPSTIECVSRYCRMLYL